MPSSRLIALLTSFSGSLGFPIRQLLLRPLESRDPKITEALEKRKQGGVAIGQERCDVCVWACP